MGSDRTQSTVMSNQGRIELPKEVHVTRTELMASMVMMVHTEHNHMGDAKHTLCSADEPHT